MFKKAGDNVHYLDRTGSHSTKGTRAGRVDIRKMDETDFDSDAAIALRRVRVTELVDLLRTLWADRLRITAILKMEGVDSNIRRGILPTLKIIEKRIKAASAEKKELRASIPKPPKKPKSKTALKWEKRRADRQRQVRALSRALLTK